MRAPYSDERVGHARRNGSEAGLTKGQGFTIFRLRLQTQQAVETLPFVRRTFYACAAFMGIAIRSGRPAGDLHPDWKPDAGLPTPRAVTARPSGLGPTDTHQVVGSPHQMRVLFRPGAPPDRSCSDGWYSSAASLPPVPSRRGLREFPLEQAPSEAAARLSCACNAPSFRLSTGRSWSEGGLPKGKGYGWDEARHPSLVAGTRADPAGRSGPACGELFRILIRSADDHAQR